MSDMFTKIILTKKFRKILAIIIVFAFIFPAVVTTLDFTAPVSGVDTDLNSSKNRGAVGGELESDLQDFLPAAIGLCEIGGVATGRALVRNDERGGGPGAHERIIVRFQFGAPVGGEVARRDQEGRREGH